MKPFNIINNNGKLEAIKSKSSFSGVIIAKINALSAKKALEIVNIRIKNGSLILPVGALKAKEKKASFSFSLMEQDRPTQKAIFCDFNGVLDNQIYDDNSSNLNLKLANMSSPEKVIKLLRLAIDENAKIIMTSLWRLEICNYKKIFQLCLTNSENPEHREFYENNEVDIKRLCRTCSTGQSSSRRNEIFESVHSHEFTHIVVFEDEHKIGEDLHEVMVSSWEGLTDEHVSRAKELLSIKI